ncbi:MAG: hypothetical protein KatS3mg103_0908 [Phycisphaerales bacterium]|nr:MAG: hypothetical protein KatS3mg103_0908 [Phycisphaerales bacterium]
MGVGMRQMRTAGVVGRGPDGAWPRGSAVILGVLAAGTASAAQSPRADGPQTPRPAVVVMGGGPSQSVSALGMGAVPARCVERMGEALGLDATQMEVALSLHEAMGQRRQALGARLREAIQQARQDAGRDDPMATINAIKAHTAAYQADLEALREAFMEDLHALLLPQQEQAWPIAERIERRWRLLGSLLEPQARVDVEELVRSRGLSQDSAQGEASAILDQWAQQIDRLLVARIRQAEALQAAPGEGSVAILPGGEDPYAPLREVDEQISQASQAAVRSLAVVLEDAGLEQAFVEAAYPWVYRPTDAERTGAGGPWPGRPHRGAARAARGPVGAGAAGGIGDPPTLGARRA